MILFEVNARGEVKSTPSRVAQGISMSDLVVLTEDNFDFVTMRLFLPSGELIEDVQFTCVQTEGGRLWHAFMPAKAVKIHGILGYQIFARGINNGNNLAGDEPTAVTARVITNRGAVRVEPGIIDADMPETAEDLGAYTLDSIYNMLDAIHAQYGNVYNDVLMHRKEIYGTDMVAYETPSRIDILEAARPVTGSFSVGDAMWVESDDGYTATIALTENPLQSGDLMLILPDGEATRKASADVVVSVKSAENGDEVDAIVLTAKSKPAVATLWYRYAVIKRGAEDTTMLPVASIVGVHDVPTYVTDWIDRVDKAAASNEQKIDNEVERLDGRIFSLSSDLANFLDVDDHTRDQLSEVLSLISANADAIEDFKNMGGAPVGSGTLVVPVSAWDDGIPTAALVYVPSSTMHEGSVMLLTPANDVTREAAAKARLSVSVNASGDNPGAVDTGDMIVLLRAETAAKPAIDMEFAYVILQTTAETSLVTLIGVDAAGSPAPTSVDLSAFDPDENGKGYITETYGEGEDAPKKVTEVIYDEAGNIIKIGNTAINWGEEG